MQESYRILLTEDFLEQPSHVPTQYLHGLNALIILLDFPLFPPHVVQIHMDETPNQVLICLHCRCMIAVFPECTFSAFPIIVLLSSSASRQLQSLRDDFSAIPVMNQEMDVVGGCHVIENDNAITASWPQKASRANTDDPWQTVSRNSFL
jgi:hypothetical protein